ncbi:DUF1631 family protein [Endozoicomonas numazuensis]|uniref:Thymidine phosphorylase n=1 Tax=Endozoicomonas numazuensis TaxID=1137799 RepID=A0A081NKB6_9GAMM|nr:DUF1631 family protein [Endozoicomonas numazuensis]KEQ18889.1 hypothetical protein GZ78_02205 [Endozoicomonas numazuensis]
MTGTSSNVVPLPSSAKLSQIGEINTAFINFFQKLVIPPIDDILTDLIKHVIELSESGKNNAQIMQFMEARQILERSKSEIIKLFEQESLKHFHQLEEEDNPPPSFSMSDLSLIENGDLEKKLAWQHAANQLSMNDNLQHFNNIQSRLTGLINLEPDRNPLGAQKICESFASALAPAPLDADLIQELLLQFALKIKPSVIKLWIEVDDHLESIGLEVNKTTTRIADIPEDQPFSESEHIQAITETHGRDSALPPLNNTSIPSNEPSQVWNEAFMDELANKLVSRVEGLLHSPSSESSNGTVSSDARIFASIELASTLTMIQDELSGQHACIFNLAESIKSALRDKGVKQKLSPRHSDLINMVGMLFEFILDDHELPDEVKKLIGLLQIPVLKLTLLEEDFLTDRHHAARELLNDMTSAGMHTTLHPETEQPVIELIEETVKYIIKHFIQNPDIFSSCHKTFNEKLHKIRESLEQTQVQIVHTQPDPDEPSDETNTEETALENKAENEFRSIITELVSRHQYTVPDSIEKMVHEAWPEVIEQIDKNSASEISQWFDVINTLDIMLWNLQPENRNSVPAEDWLILKNMLLDYLNESGHNPFIVVEWMHALNTLISMPIEFPREAEVITVSPESSITENEQKEPDMEEIILQSQRVDKQTHDSDFLMSEAIDVISEEYETIEKRAPNVHADVQISVGQWVEFIGKQDQHFRCKLSSINAASNRFIFVNSSGMKVAEMSGYELKLGIENERIRIIEDTQFFDKALHAVMDKFLKF